MSTKLATCNHLHDDGQHCNSVAAKNQHYCVYHLRHRARLMRMAQARARSERFDLKLPPLESMYAVQSALTQLAEALAADMIELKRADRLIRVLTVASRNLLKAEKWPAAPVFHSEHAADVDVAAEYGLPRDLDLGTPPEVAFPQSVILSVGAAASAPPESKDPFVSERGSGDDIEFSPRFPISPENVEVCEIYKNQGPDAAQVRCDQLERNRARRELLISRKRYADIALRRNIRVAAQKLAMKQTQAEPAAPPMSDLDVQVAAAMAKKSPSSVTCDSDDYRAAKEAATA